MNSDEARFMRLKRYSQEQIGELHDIERVADQKWRDNFSEGRRAEAGEGWSCEGSRFMTRLDRILGPYWDSAKPQDEQAREVDFFINSHVVKRAFAKMNASEKTEMEAQHEADWLVWKDAPMPHLTKGSGQAF